MWENCTTISKNNYDKTGFARHDIKIHLFQRDLYGRETTIKYKRLRLRPHYNFVTDALCGTLT
jgi:hypothetical protein